MPRKHTSRPGRRGAPARPPGQARVSPRATPTQAPGAELLDMEQAIALLKTTRPTFYRWLRGGKVKGMKVGRQWRFYREDVERFLKGKEPRTELPADIGPLVRSLNDHLRRLRGTDPSPAETEPVRRAVALLIMVAVKSRASDVHLEPYEDGVHLRCRVDGVLHPIATCDLRLLPAIAEELKKMAAGDVLEKRLPQDGRILLSLPEPDGEVDLRVCFVPAYLGEAVTLRILKRTDVILSLDRISYAPADRDRLDRALGAPWGLLVFSGPTGSGKTTVLYACLKHLVAPTRKLMSAEDPVEFLIDGVTQVPVREKIGLTFERTVRAFLRSAPNVIMIGEIRNRDALEAALQGALTGHLVMTTLHTDSAAAALKRMVDIGAAPFVVAEATRLVSAQRLVRTLCPDCSVPGEPPQRYLAQGARLAGEGGLAWDALPKDFRKPAGCAKCSHTGFRGRTIVAEMLEVTPEIADALREGATASRLESIAVGQGMTTLAADGLRRAAEGQTTIEEVLSVLDVAELPRAGWSE